MPVSVPQDGSKKEGEEDKKVTTLFDTYLLLIGAQVGLVSHFEV